MNTDTSGYQLTKAFKIGSNRGNARIWLENATLAQYGFARGDGITIDYLSGGEIDIQRALPDIAQHTVAGRNRGGKAISIIDINSAALTEFVNGATTATITYTQNRLTIQIGAQA